MAWLSRLLMKMAYLVSPQQFVTSWHQLESQSLSPTILERPSSPLSPQSSTDQRCLTDTERFHQLQADLVAQNLETAKFNTALVRMAVLPHRQYVCQLKHDGMEWIAVYGSEEMGNLLVGRGECPANALRDFDNKWLGISE